MCRPTFTGLAPVLQGCHSKPQGYTKQRGRPLSITNPIYPLFRYAVVLFTLPFALATAARADILTQPDVIYSDCAIIEGPLSLGLDALPAPAAPTG